MEVFPHVVLVHCSNHHIHTTFFTLTLCVCVFVYIISAIMQITCCRLYLVVVRMQWMSQQHQHELENLTLGFSI